MNIFDDFQRRVAADPRRGWARAARCPPGSTRRARRGRAAARSLPWRSRHQRRDGAGQGRRACNPRALADADRGRAARRAGRRRRSRSPGPASSTSALDAACLPGGRCGDPVVAAAAYGRGRAPSAAPRSTSSTSRPTRPGRCMSATAAARCSAMRWPTCSPSPATTVTREYYINDAGAQVDVLARSAFLRYREALGEDDRRDPRGALSRRLPEARRRGAGRGARRGAARPAGGANGCRSCARSPST